MGSNGSGKGYLLVAIAAVLMVFFLPACAQARENFRGMITTNVRSMTLEEIKHSKETCIECHSKTTPRIVEQHRKSGHTAAGVDCVDCHGSDHEKMPLVTGKKACAKCHQKETEQMMNSKHAQSWSNMWSNARFQALPKSMAQQGCSRCHDIGVGFADIKDVRCDYCHSTHEFSVEEAKNPASCTTCHMGPDHPQAEAYAASAHGQLYEEAKAGGMSQTQSQSQGQSQGQGQKPNTTCASCHLSEGNHNADISKDKGAATNKTTESNCIECHDAQFSQQWTGGAAQVKMMLDQQVEQAKAIITQLDAEGLLNPSPREREANPVKGQTLVLDKNMLYTGISKPEALYFEMFKFAAATGAKSATHQDFDRAGNMGIKEMARLMSELQNEADTLRSLKAVQPMDAKVEKEKKGYTGALLMGGGLFLGAVGGGITYLVVRKKHRGVWTLLPVLILTGILLMGGAGKALAWEGSSADQSKCSTCHKDQSDQLKSGKHSGLKCLDCHQAGQGTAQVKKPETCGKCHSGEAGYQMEAYETSPHGIQYAIKGTDQWIPTCAACHMPQGIHAPQGSFEGGASGGAGIKEVCLKCHITADVYNFSEDLQDIYKNADLMAGELRDMKSDLINRGIFEQDSLTVKSGLLKKASPEDKAKVEQLAGDFAGFMKAGEASYLKTRSGAAHVNPDYTHWYGNGYLNLNLAKARGTAKELETMADKVHYTGDESGMIGQIPFALGGALLGFTGIFFFLSYINRKRIGQP